LPTDDGRIVERCAWLLTPGLCVYSYSSRIAQTTRTIILAVGKERPCDGVRDQQPWIPPHTVRVSIIMFVIFLVKINLSEQTYTHPSIQRRVMTTNSYRCFGEAANEEPIKLMLR